MKGEVVYLYAFDVANEIVTEKVRKILAEKPFPYEIRTDHGFPRDLPLYKPLAIERSELGRPLAGQPVRLLIRIYNVGVVSVAMRVRIEASGLAELEPFHLPKLDDGLPLDQLARQLCQEVSMSLQDALVESSPASEPEAYTVFCLRELDGERDANRWLAEHRGAAAELLSESKPGGLSDMQIDEVLRVRLSYSNADLAIIDWDAALVVDLDGYVDDVLYVLELANLQLEEYRMMDQRLDRYLDRAYDELKRRRFGLLGTYSATLRKLRLFRVDVTKLSDEVTNITKFHGDWYLARVYLCAAERFYLNRWRQSVEHRLAQLDELYSVVNADVNNWRMVWLEVLIVVFFAIDLIFIVLFRK